MIDRLNMQFTQILIASLLTDLCLVMISRIYAQDVKRDIGCSEVAGPTYTTEGETFTILCDTDFPWFDTLNVSYTLTFPDCMNACVQWNVRGPLKCVAVSWVYDYYGPAGVAGGSLCSFFWTTDEGGYNISSIDGAQLQIAPKVHLQLLIYSRGSSR